MNISNMTTWVFGLVNNATEEESYCQRTNITTKFGNILHFQEALKPVIDIAMLVLLIVIMLPIGCEVSWSKLKAHVKHPIGIGIGIVCQFFIIPLMAYTLMRSSAIDGLHATEMLIISCCPGGILSNAFTYFCEGDLALSVTMTLVTTLLSLGAIPLNLWIYGRSFKTKNLILPYNEISLSFVSVPLLVIIGMILRWKFAVTASFVAKVGKYIGHLIVITCIILEAVVFPDMFLTVPSNLYGVLFALPLLGLSLGYILAFSFKQDVPVRKTVAIECGIQNVPIALTIICYSFESKVHKNVLLVPGLYAFVTMVGYTLVSIIYYMCKQYLSQRMKKEEGFDLESPEKYS